MSTGWDNATLKKLKALTGKGLSTSEIGKRLGMSKNAIVGKLNRLGWNAKAGGAATVTVSVTKKAEKKPADKKTDVTPVKKAAAVKKAPAKKEVAVKVSVKKTEKNQLLKKKLLWPRKSPSRNQPVPRLVIKIWPCISVLFNIRWIWQI